MSTSTTTVTGSADLSVTKSDGVSSVTAGDGITRTYTITVANGGPSDATSVMLSDTWPAGFTRSGAPTASQGTCSGSPSFTCTLGDDRGWRHGHRHGQLHRAELDDRQPDEHGDGRERDERSEQRQQLGERHEHRQHQRRPVDH